MNEALIRPFQHPNEFQEYTQTPFAYARAMCISLYKSCEELKSKCLELQIQNNLLNDLVREKITALELAVFAPKKEVPDEVPNTPPVN